ncbi:MAG: glycosyltransferase [bacterium]
MKLSNNIRATIIISVYKNSDALIAVLNSLRQQTVQDFEVIVSEDGESAEIKKSVAEYDWFCPHQHLTQADDGWQKNRALNRAIIAAKTDWLIFVDGDCLLHRRFVEMHLRYAQPQRILVGKRVKLSQPLSEKLLTRELSLQSLACVIWLRLITHRGCRYVDEGIFVPPFGSCQLRSAKKLTGCNMSFSREAIMAINGFDEDYTLPAVGEDADLVWRFRAAGFELFSVRNRAITYHLYHKENWSDQSVNLQKMKDKQECNTFVCERGLNLHNK